MALLLPHAVALEDRLQALPVAAVETAIIADLALADCAFIADAELFPLLVRATGLVSICGDVGTVTPLDIE
jgi:hypothetical protein